MLIMTEDVLDAPIRLKRAPSIEALDSELLGKVLRKDQLHYRHRGKRALKIWLNKLRLKRCAIAHISEPDPTFKVFYLGNVITGWAKGEGCLEKPLATLWKNYTGCNRPDVKMQLTVSGGGLRATTREHGLTEYWANRLTTCAAPSSFPRMFCWVYRHEGRKLRHELRCHAVLCPSSNVARQIEEKLKDSLQLALNEFRKEKISKQNARLSLVNCVYDNPTIPRRKILLSTGANNYRPPLERSKSAPKLTIIEENLEEDEVIFEGRPRNKINYTRSGSLDCGRTRVKLFNNNNSNIFPIDEDFELERASEDLLIEKLVDENFANDILESCNMNGWLRNFEKPDDEGSLSSGCESASTVTSDTEQTGFIEVKIDEEDEENEAEEAAVEESKEEMQQDVMIQRDVHHALHADEDGRVKTELDFKLGGRVRYDGMRLNVNDEVSLVPVGEIQPDFSSLKVFKKKCEKDKLGDDADVDDGNGSEGEESGCSDESGYGDDVIDCASSIGNIVLV